MPGGLLIAASESKTGNRKFEPSAVQPWDVAAVARTAGLVGTLLLLAVLIDDVLALIPWAFGNPEWETGTISSLVVGLPLTTIALGLMWASVAVRGRRGMLFLLGLGFLLGAVLVLAMLVLFATNIPTALRATQGEAHLGILKLVVKTLITGLMFSVAYIVMGVLSLRQTRLVPSTEMF